MDHHAEIFLNTEKAHGDLEPDALVFRQEDHAAGTALWTVNDGRSELYRRTTPNTAQWEAQVRHDVAELFPGDTVNFTRPDGDDW